VRLWDVASGESRVLGARPEEGARPAARPLSDLRVVFAPDGRTVAASAGDGTVRVYVDDLPHEPEALAVWLAAQTDARDPAPAR
jgi:hypothetical protein